MGKWKERRQEKKEAKKQKKAQKQEAKKQRKEQRQAAKMARKDAKTQIKLAKANKKNAAAEVKQAKAQAIQDGTWQSPAQQFLGGAKDIVGSIFGGGDSSMEEQEYTPDNYGQTLLVGGNPNTHTPQNNDNGKSKTGLYVGIGGGLLALVLLIVGLKNLKSNAV